MLKKITLFVFTSLVTLSLFSQTASHPKAWSKSPFEHYVFMDQHGQFESKHAYGKDVKFGAFAQGLELYFTATGMSWRHEARHPLSEEQRDELEKQGKKIEANKMLNIEQEYFGLDWIGANANTSIEASDLQKQYYSYTDPKDIRHSIKSSCYKQIIYKNLYPGIDVEYILPEKGGVKYTLIVHPGADLSQVKMKYRDAKDVEASNGNIIIRSKFGDFTDHAPSAYYEDSKGEVACSFQLNNGEVSFASSYDKNRTLIIDPWTASPSFTFNRAFDVNYDLNGNVYACGGSSPFQETKFDPNGNVLWTYTCSQFFSYYGDFAVDEFSGSSYLCEGFSGCRVIKVNSAGVEIGMYPGTISGQMNEIWRSEYNRCIQKIVLACGGTAQAFQGAVLDTTMGTMTPINVFGAGTALHDCALLCIDPGSSDCYMATARSQVYPSVLDNVMNKCPIPNLIPPAWSVSDGHAFIEVATQNYYSPTSNGFNGMAAGPGYLYTYDGATLKQWNKTTGAFIAQVSTGGTAFSSGGLTADVCDNVYAGVGNQIQEYNSSLTLINTYSATSTCYDVKLGSTASAKLYASGDGFVQSIDVAAINQTITVTSTNSGCANCSGTATVSSLLCGNPSSFSYSWSTSPVQTTATATGLCAGTYTVTVASACSNTMTATVIISGSGNMTISTSSTPVSCNGGCNGTGTITLSGGTTPYTYSWNTSPVQTTPTATGLCAGTYSVVITDSGSCSGTFTITITQPAPMSVTFTSTNASCFGSTNGTATATASSGTTPYTYSWSNSQTGQTATGLGAGTYTVTVTDANNCTHTATVAVTQPAAMTLSATPANATCFGVCNGSASATANGGSTPYTYSWNTTPVQNSANATGLCAGNYVVTITDAGNCSQTASVTVTQPPSIQANIAVTPCTDNLSNASATANPSGGATPYSYFWLTTPLQFTQTATGLGPGTYQLIVVDNNNCPDTVTAFIDICPLDSIFVPNVFTPNGDGTNDIFFVYTEGYKSLKVDIYDRWGLLIYEWTDLSKGWNGKVKSGANAPDGTYYYILHGEKMVGGFTDMKGFLQLLRHRP